MSKIKKVLAVVLAMAMVMAMSIVSFAEGETPATTGTATVKGVSEEGAVVKAYQLVTYDSKGEYVVVAAAQAKGYEVGSRDAKVVADLAGDTSGLDSTTLTKQSNGDYTATLGAGTYLVLVTNSGDTIYNPMLLSLEVSYPDGVGDGSVDADSNYIVNGAVVYAKSTTSVPVDKKITDVAGNVIETGGVYDDVYAGTTVYFTLTGTIPSYSAEYTKATYTLIDTVSSGLSLDNTDNKLVKIISDQLDDNAATVSVNGTVITIAFETKYILANANTNKQIKITYPATVNGTTSNFDPATNTLDVVYSNDPSHTTNGTPVETKHYTFDLNNVLVKVNNENEELAGAEFKLTSNTDSTKVFTSTSDANGNIAFSGLDEGTYTLEETKAPAGYSLSGKKYTVEITPAYRNDVLVSYTVTVKDGDDVIGEITHTKDSRTGEAAEILNTKLSELPSTGGIGTTIFTVVGCLIMIAAAAMFFVSRRRTEK